jgi:hypothetical protein
LRGNLRIRASKQPDGASFFYRHKIETMTLAKRPAEVRLRTEMVEEFKKNIMVAQVIEPAEK